MDSFVVHTVPGSPYARSVLTALIEKGAPYRLAVLDTGGQHHPDYLALHPFGKMPVLEHGAARIYETQAILRYLDRVLPIPPMTPTDPLAAAKMDMVLNINDHYLYSGVANIIVFHRVIAPLLFGAAPDEAAIDATMPAAHRVFAELSQLLGEAPFFGGPALSLADLAVAPQLELFTRGPEWDLLTADRPNLRTYEARMATRPSFLATTMETLRGAAA